MPLYGTDQGPHIHHLEDLFEGIECFGCKFLAENAFEVFDSNVSQRVYTGTFRKVTNQSSQLPLETWWFSTGMLAASGSWYCFSHEKFLFEKLS